MKKMKRLLTLALALCLSVPSIPFVAKDAVVIQAEETTKSWEDWVDSLNNNASMAIALSGDDQKFDGNRVYDVSTYANAMSEVSEGSIIMRFKNNSIANHGVILGTRNSSGTLPSDISAKNATSASMVITNKDQFYLVYSYDRAGINGPHSFVDGEWHTVVLSGSATGKNIRLTIDGKEVWNISNRSDLAGMFSKLSGLDTVTIGGHKDGSNVVGGFNGSISNVIVTKEVISDEDAIAISAAGYTGGTQMGAQIASTMLTASIRDNTWLFTGGEDVEGGFEQTHGIRNYVGQFEEYIRWRTIDGHAYYPRQRYTFSTAYTGQTLASIVENFEERVATFKNKAIVYMVGAEDFNLGSAGINAFKQNLKSFIDQSLALKDGGAFVIIQKPFARNNAQTNANIELYNGAVDEVVEAYKANENKYTRINVVDHYTKTKDNADFKANKLVNDKLNAQGHLEISKQFAQTVVNFTGTAYPAGDVTLNRVELDMPDNYLDVIPNVISTADSLKVDLPTNLGISQWYYEVIIEDVTVSGTADSDMFTIADLPTGKDYVLKVLSADKETQLVTTKGTITDGATAVKNTQVLDAKQQKIVDMVNGDQPMTWLFMGDSITHASGLTYGYDGIAQIFEKYVKGELGRKQDVVLNTAVANADTATTLAELDQRLTNYTPDVVSIMIGTNDCSSRVSITVEQFETNVRTILDTIEEKYPNAVILLRSMTPFFNDGNREPYRQSYMDVISKLANEYDTIYVDQYTSLKEATSTYTWLARKMFTDNLHPEANGHRVMAYMFMKACGLWSEDSPMTNLMYSMDIATEANSLEPTLIVGKDQIGLSVTGLETAANMSFGDVVVKAESKVNGQTYEVSVKEGVNYALLNNLIPESNYTVTVSAHLTNTAKEVTFAPVEVTLSDEAESNIEVYLDNKKVTDLSAGTVVGTLSVDGLVLEGDYLFELCDEANTNNDFFEIDGNTLKVKKALVEGTTYTVCVKASNGDSSKEVSFEIKAVGEQFIFGKDNLTIANPVDLSSEAYANTLYALEEGTVVVDYTSTSSYGVQSLFSIGNGSANNQNRHFHVYVTPNGRLGVEIRNESGLNYHIYKDGAINVNGQNKIAFKADKDNNEYKLFVNGELVHTVSAANLGGFKFVNDITGVDNAFIGATKRNTAMAYNFGGSVHSIKVYGSALSDAIVQAMTKAETPTPEVPESKEQYIFHKDDATGANYQRIPALLTLKSGRVIAAADERFGGTHDSPNNIDIGVSVSDDDGKTWSDPELVLYFDDFADDELELPRGAQVRVNASASFIDPILFQDAETERVFLIADAMVSGYGSPQAVAGSGYKTVNGKSYMQLKKKGESAYNYTIRENGVIYNDTTNTATEYSVNGNYELYKNGVALTVKQKSASYNGSSIVVTTTNKDVKMNVFYDSADFVVLPTTWLCMKYSDDDGDTWSDPIFLNGQVKNDPERIMIVGPGRGTQLTIGEHAGRILVPVYNNNFSGVIYSDDHGDTWTYKRGPVTNGVAMSETQFVEMPDGSVRVFARSNNSKIASAVSLDGGETWSDAQYVDGLTQPGWGSQLSVLRYSGLIDGKEAIILSSPAGVGSYRRDGRIKIGLISDTGATGIDRYAIDWKYDFQVNDTNTGYAYSCLTELDNENIAVLYERYDSYAPAELHAQNAMIYQEFSFDQLMKGETVTIRTEASANAAITKRNTVLKGADATVEAIANEGYVFVEWVDANNEFVSSDAIYSFEANEDMTLKVVVRQATHEDVNKMALIEKINEARNVVTENYTAESVAALNKAIREAIAVYNDKEVTQAEVDVQVSALVAAIDGLVWDGPLPLNPDHLINKTANEVTVESYSSQCGGAGEPSENGYGQASTTVDYNNNSYWHSNWQSNNGEKHTITYNLGKEYTLEDVTFLPRQGGRNGDIHKFEVYVGNSTDYTQNTLTGEYVFAETGPLNQSEWYRANVALNGEFSGQYVTIRITGSYGDSGNNQFASMAEIRFYGTEATAQPSVDKAALNALIAEVEALNEADYSRKSWSNLQTALTATKDVVADANATQEVVDQAKAGLEAKKAALVNVVAMKEAIAAAEAKLAEADKYTDETVATLTSVYNNAVYALNSNIGYVQADADMHVANINNAIAGLVEKPVEPELTAPAKVENVKAKDTNYKTITLTWDASEGATAYDVYRKAYDSEEFKLYKTVTDTTLAVSGVMTGKEYAFYVVAKNEVGAAQASETVAQATTLHGKVKLTIEKVSTATFKLSWNKIDGATRYIVYRKRNDDKMKKVLTLGAKDLTYTTAEMPNGEYQFILKAGRYDSKDRVMTDASNTVKGSVEKVAPAVTLKAGTKSVKVSWKAMEGVTHYQVYRATSKDGKYTKLITTKELSYTAKSLSSGKKYFFKVRGYKTYKSGEDIKYAVYTPYSTIKYATAK